MNNPMDIEYIYCERPFKGHNVGGQAAVSQQLGLGKCMKYITNIYGIKFNEYFELQV